MTGPEHYTEAERLLTAAAEGARATGRTMADTGKSLADRRADTATGAQAVGLLVSQAQAHATLALAAATAYPAIKDYTGDELGAESRGWAAVTA